MTGHFDHPERQHINYAINEDDETMGCATAQEEDLQKILQSDIRRYKRVGVGVGLLCAVLVLINIAVPLYLYQSNKVERDQLVNNYNQVQARNTNLTEDREQLQTSFNRLKTSFDQLLTRHNQLTEEKGQLQDSFDQLQTSFTQLQTRYNLLTKQKGQLESSSHQLQTRFDQLQTRHNQLTQQKDQLKTRFEQLQTRHNNFAEERDDMTMRLCESPGWQKFDRGCYYISTEKKTWEESRQWCTDRQSDLIVIKSKAKQDFVASFNKRIWLGLTDRDSEGSFQWVDGTPLTTPTYWVPGEPEENTHPNAEEDCVEYYYKPPDPDRGWNDVPCSTSVDYWICERVVC